jgi:hypothetical protein
MLISPIFVRINIDDPLLYSLYFIKLYRALEILLKTIKDELVEIIRTGVRAKDYISFKYAIKVFRHFDNKRELDKAMEIIAL